MPTLPHTLLPLFASPTHWSTPPLLLACAASRSLTELFAGDPECGKPKQNPGQAGLARTHTFAGAGLDDELELKKLQVGQGWACGVPSLHCAIACLPAIIKAEPTTAATWNPEEQVPVELLLPLPLPSLSPFRQVFVRIRPGVTAGAPRWDAENCIHATSKYSIAIAPPEGSQAYKSGDRGQTYSFTRVFDEHTAQTEYYEATAAPLVGCWGREVPCWVE